MNLLKPSFSKRIAFFLIADILLFYIALHLSYALRFDFVIEPRFMESFLRVFGILLLFKLLFMSIFRIYNITWRFFSLDDSKRLIKAHIAAAIAFITAFFIFSDFFLPIPRSVIIIDFFLSLILTGALRISKRMMLEQLKQGSDKPTLIIGVNNKTSSVIRNALDGEIGYFPVAIAAILPQNKNAINTYINNVQVHDDTDMEAVIQGKSITAAIITGSFTPDILQTLFDRLNQAGITEIKQVKLLGSQHEKLEDLSIEDLLARHPKDLDTNAIAAFINNKTVLITGAGGSIGSEIALQCQQFGAKALVLVDNSEYNLYTIGERLPDATLSLQSVMHKEGLQKVFDQHDFDLVIHAAAYKHVPMCEQNIDIAVTNNILGTKHIIDLSIEHQVQKVVVISTDKAVRPTNIMGATKRVSELYAQNVDAKDTEIVAVRFGNVLGSSGSVIPKFKEQIENGGPVTVTHANMTRYFMMIPEACQLVLQAASIAKGNELFILEMGEPVKIIDLAKQMIRLYGKEEEIEIIFTGLRPGEKMFEELLISEEEHKTQYASIYVTNPTYYDIAQLNRDIEALISSEEKLSLLNRIVPEFDHRP